MLFHIAAQGQRRWGFSFFVRSCAGTELGRWQRLCDRLTLLQRRIRFPAVETFTVNGQSYELPLKSIRPARAPNAQDLQYLAGFFDGDGCVGVHGQTGQMGLIVSQNIDSAEVLLHFRSCLGGGIYRQSVATGSKKAKLQWEVVGSKMRDAAAALSRVPSMKQAQLFIATSGNVAQSDRLRVAKELAALKQRQHVPDQWTVCLWPYFAGFFDAEGSIVCRPVFGIHLRVGQVNRGVLKHLRGFLHGNQLESWSLYRHTHCSELVCSNLKECKRTLELLLLHGLRVKREQAELALALTPENHLQTRDAISALNGWQGRYRRLDRDGIARTAEIQKLQKRLYHQEGLEYTSLQHQLDHLRSEHALQKLISRCNMLRKDLRKAFRQGGQLSRTGSPEEDV